MNALKLTASGGYSNFELIYGDITQEAQSMTSSSVDKSFAFVGLMKYFTLNVNLSLIAPIFALIIFSVYMIRKIKKRQDYIRSK